MKDAAAVTTSKKQSPSRWRTLAWAVPAALVGLLAVVLLARWVRDLPAVASFMADYPGGAPQPDATPEGIPGWLAWQHFFNAFFLVLLVRTGWLIHAGGRQKGHWQRRNTGRFRTKGKPAKISLNLWLHLAVDLFWVLNGLAFVVLLFATGQWMRIVPTDWSVFPNALSVLVQYASLDWPTEDGWVTYNALQQLTYFVTVFVAAPLAVLSGLRMSPGWPKDNGALNRVLPIGLARALHFPVMIYFVAFTVSHVALVLATGAMDNLNHMYAARDDGGWLGLAYFAGSVVVMVAAWVLAKPVFTQPVAALTGKVTR
ncbi:hypothetical protein V2J56_13120 [Georgenia sp. MJ206]